MIRTDLFQLIPHFSRFCDLGCTPLSTFDVRGLRSTRNFQCVVLIRPGLKPANWLYGVLVRLSICSIVELFIGSYYSIKTLVKGRISYFDEGHSLLLHRTDAFPSLPALALQLCSYFECSFKGAVPRSIAWSTFGLPKH